MSEEKTVENNKEGNSEYEGTIHANYLLSATNYLKGIPSNALRSHWNILLSDVMHMKHLTVSERQSKYSTCEYCRTPWRNGHYSVKVMPKRKLKKKMRKIVRKVKQQKELTKIQKRLANVIHTGPTVVVNCKICNKSTKIKVPQDKPIASIIKETEQMKEMLELNKKLKRLQKNKYRKKNRKQKKQEMASNLKSVNPTQLDDTKENSKTVHNQNKISNNNKDDDEDVVILDESLEVTKRSDTNSKKRKFDDCDDDVIAILNPEPKKVKKEDVRNAPSKTQFGVQSKQLPQCNTKKNNSPLFHNSNSSSKKNKLSKIVTKDEVKRNPKIDFEKKQIEKKKNLSRWKMLVADEEAKVTKTSSLHDFLSTL